VAKVGGLIGEITAASQEQAQGIEQINRAVSEMDKVVQQNASNSEEFAAASEEMSAQATQMQGSIEHLMAMVGGSGKDRDETKPGEKSGMRSRPDADNPAGHSKNAGSALPGTGGKMGK
jgi:methyl-accepting chemotaxis protein